MEIICDTTNDQFMLYDYLSSIDKGIVEYIKENDACENFSCIAVRSVNNHYCIAVSKPSCKIIMVNKFCSENYTEKHDRYTDIVYNNILVRVTPILDLHNLNYHTQDFNFKISNIGTTDHIIDTFNCQFKLYSHLDSLGENISEYLENNNIYNYYCIAIKIVNNTQYIVTSDTIKNMEVGNRLIVVSKNCSDNNFINNYGDTTIINYENITIKINQLTTNINEYIKCVGLILKPPKEKKLYRKQYEQQGIIDLRTSADKNIKECDVVQISGARNEKIIDICNFLQKLEFNPYFVPIKPIKPIHTIELGVYSLPVDFKLLSDNTDTLKLGEFHVLSNNNPLPKFLKTLVLDSEYNKQIRLGNLPTSLHTIIFGEFYNKIISPHVLPQSLRVIKFGDIYNVEIYEKVLPTLLHTLNFGCSYNQPILPRVLPPNLHTLKFGESYNHVVKPKTLPHSLHTLQFDERFSKTLLKNSLPSNLKILRFSIYYKQPINENVLPLKLETLVLGSLYDKVIEDYVLPSSIKEIIFECFEDENLATLNKLNLVPPEHASKVLYKKR
jgi:hypothetical protein